MTKIAKMVIDTNIFIKPLEKALERQSIKSRLDTCKYALKVLEKIIERLYKALDESQFVYLELRQIDEIKRWFHTNVCKNTDTKDVDKLFEMAFAQRRRGGMSLDKGIRPLKSSQVRTRKRRLRGHRQGKQVQEQIELMREEVDKSILYFSLGCGLEGEKVKVITADRKLANKLCMKVNELGIRGNIEVKYVSPEEVSLYVLNDLVRDP